MKKNLFLFLVMMSFQCLWAQNTSPDVAPSDTKKEIETIKLQPLTPEKPPYNDTFGYVGITLGLPGIVNLNVGGYKEHGLGGQIGISSIHLIGALFDSDDESDDDGNSSDDDDDDDDDDSFFFIGQANINMRLYATENFLLGASFAAGTANYSSGDAFDSSVRLAYVGPAVHVMYKSFFLESGWAWGKDYSEAKEDRKTIEFPLFQIGYVGRF